MCVGQGWIRIKSFFLCSKLKWGWSFDLQFYHVRKGYLKWYKEKLVIQNGDIKRKENFLRLWLGLIVLRGNKSEHFVITFDCVKLNSAFSFDYSSLTISIKSIKPRSLQYEFKSIDEWNSCFGMYTLNSSNYSDQHEWLYPIILCLYKTKYLDQHFFLSFLKKIPISQLHMVTDWVIWYKLFFSYYICGFNRTRAIIQLCIPFLVESVYTLLIYKTLVKMAIVKVWPVLEISFSFICQDLTNDKKS